MSSEPADELISAIKKGDYQAFTSVLGNGVDINYSDEIGWTPLFYAVAEGDLRMSYDLLRRGASIEHKDYSGWSVLGHATLDGNDDICKLLTTGSAFI
jgi:ankyrin repeat protein